MNNIFVRIPYILITFNFTINMLLAQFSDDFQTNSTSDWIYFSGDGNVEMNFTSNNGTAEITVDASKDIHNIWWSLIRRTITPKIDLSLLEKEEYELRIEAKVKVSSAPKRINLHLNTQRTTDFHSNLMEYEIPDTNNWHIISMATDKFDAVIGDTVNAQLALMDWGLGKYSVQLDYFKVDVVNKNSAGSDLGNIIPYHPYIPSTTEFNKSISSSDEAIISSMHNKENFADWKNYSYDNKQKVLTLNSDQIIIIKWDTENLKNIKIKENGLFELTLDSYQTGTFSLEELGQVRLVEIFGGNPLWDRNSVTFQNFIGNSNLNEVFNSQHIYDLDLTSQKGEKRYFTVSKFVLNRIISGKTLGLALKALGPINASFRVGGENSPKLYFNVIEEKNSK
ncbi:MAG: hypothetical protein MUP82_02810 [Candidatus Marinimicrobia bacterium]|nr:hypothetical protein [Candidatus Neomarinimicrobiota bacterium]